MQEIEEESEAKISGLEGKLAEAVTEAQMLKVHTRVF